MVHRRSVLAGAILMWLAMPCLLLTRAEARIIETEKNIHSQHGEELIIRDFFKDRRGGFFVDVGAAEYKKFSNTYYLEKELGWSGIAIDANAAFEADYKKHRPATKFYCYLVGDTNDESRPFYVVQDEHFVSTTSKFWLAALPRVLSMKEGKKKVDYKTVQVPSITLDRLLEQTDVKQIDLLTMDIELGEPAALAGFGIDRWKPKLVCVESLAPTIKPILKYFYSHGYEVIEEYLKYDKRNLYFKPKN